LFHLQKLQNFSQINEHKLLSECSWGIWEDDMWKFSEAVLFYWWKRRDSTSRNTRPPTTGMITPGCFLSWIPFDHKKTSWKKTIIFPFKRGSTLKSNLWISKWNEDIIQAMQLKYQKDFFTYYSPKLSLSHLEIFSFLIFSKGGLFCWICRFELELEH
jgi:hypothetical protein